MFSFIEPSVRNIVCGIYPRCLFQDFIFLNTSVLSTYKWPWSGLNTPKITSARVVLPAPDGPINATDLFFGIIKLTLSRIIASRSGYLKLTCSNLILLLNVISFVSPTEIFPFSFSSSTIFLFLYTISTAILLYDILFMCCAILPAEGRIRNAATANTDSVGIK